MSGDEPAVALRELGRAYGERVALAGVTLTLPRGRTLAVFGANGAGKTTLLRILATLLRPHAGTARVLGRELPREGWAVRGRVGLLAHEPLLYRELTPLENLDLYGRLYRIRERRERIGMLLERFALWEVRHERVDTFSRGMTQRLALCRTLLHQPQLLLLDEPYAGLDTEGAELVDRELQALAGSHTVALATHAPGRVETLASDRLTLAGAA